MQIPQAKLAIIAAGQIGTQEDAAHTNRGSEILKYQQATNLEGQGYPWCAGFVDYCLEQAILKFPDVFGVTMAERPRTASAFAWEDWARSHGCVIWRNDTAKAQAGDVIIYTFSHIGIVYSNDGPLITIEGNTNENGGRDGYEVAKRDRTNAAAAGLIHCFCRLPVKALPA